MLAHGEVEEDAGAPMRAAFRADLEMAHGGIVGARRLYRLGDERETQRVDREQQPGDGEGDEAERDRHAGELARRPGMAPAADKRIPQVEEGLGQGGKQAHRGEPHARRIDEHDIGIAIAAVHQHGHDLAAGGQLGLGHRVGNDRVLFFGQIRHLPAAPGTAAVEAAAPTAEAAEAAAPEPTAAKAATFAPAVIIRQAARDRLARFP